MILNELAKKELYIALDNLTKSFQNTNLAMITCTDQESFEVADVQTTIRQAITKIENLVFKEIN